MTDFEKSILRIYEAELKNTVNDLIQYNKLLKGNLNSKFVYHYTDSNGLLGIIQNQFFFATNASFLNDRYELEYGKAVFIEDLRKRFEQNNKEEDKEVINKLITSVESINGSNYFTVCFSAHNDDLNQWVKYGDGGKGFCLGFKTKWLDDFFGPYSNVLPVIYKKDIQLRIVKQLIDEVFLCNAKHVSSTNEFSDLFFKAFANIFTQFCLFFKSNFYSSEKEYRIIICKDEIYNRNREIKFRINTGKLIIPYLETVPISEKDFPENYKIFIDKNIMEGMQSVKIESVLIGPKQNDKAIISCKMLLQKLKYESAAILKSNVPLI